jgi:PTS system ascorbate-specific IIA component
MPALLLIAHAPLASSLKAVAGHVYPDCSRRLVALDVAPGANPDDVEAEARALLATLDQPEALILADVFGATPCNVALKVADGSKIRVVTGVNVPMVWRALCYADEPLEALVTRALAGATQGVMQVAAPKRQNQSPHVFKHDQVDPHHQQ